MVYYANADDAEPDSFIVFRPVYYDSDDDQDLPKRSNILFDFEILYSRSYQESDEEEDIDDIESREMSKSLDLDRDWIIEGDPVRIEAKVSEILDMIDVPRYRDIVSRLTSEILDLDMLHKVKKIQVSLDVIVQRFPGEFDEYDGDDDVEVRLAVAPAGEEAVVQHLETVVLENEGFCVICMDKIQVGSDVETGRMPCMHVFHRTCGENWLRSSGCCPVCRAVFPN